MATDRNLRKDIELLLEQSLNASTVFDELTMLRASLRLYVDGNTAEDAAAGAAKLLSDSLSKHTTNP